MEPVFEVAAEPRSHRKAIVAGSIVSVLLVALAVAAVRGVWSDDVARDPKESRDGIQCQLYKAPGGAKQVRCSMAVDYPAPKAWAVVTDYEHFSEIFPYMTDAKVARQPDGLYAFSGVVSSHIGTWPVAVHVKHDVSPAASVASWDEPGGRFKVNRGSWTVSPLGPEKALVVYEVELKITPYPTFILRNVLLSRLPSILRAVEARLAREPR